MPPTESPTPPTPTSAPPPATFLAGAAEFGVVFDPSDTERLGRFLELLLTANQTTNLTAITDPLEAWHKHILDAMSLVPVIASLSEPESPLKTLVDIGSGGGVPGIPLAIVLPDLHVTLVEATGKKVDFLKSAAAALNLTNVNVVQARAETLGQDRGAISGSGAVRSNAHRESYDIAAARALGHLAVVAELCGPLVRPGGFLLAVKGAKAGQELEEAAKALAEIGLRHAETIATPTGRIVVMEKTIRTPRTYPRRDGEPARAPIGIRR